MKDLTRMLSYLSAFFGILTLIQLKSEKVNAILSMPKLFAGTLSPFLALAGGLGALSGSVRKDRRAVWTGLLGVMIAVRYILRVTAQHNGFQQAFGADWQSRISPELQQRMLPKRWSPLRKHPPQVPWQQNVVFDTHVETGDPLLADIWQPPPDVPPTGLAIIFLHGSAWAYFDKDLYSRYFFRHLAAQGHVIMDVSYTLAPKAQLYEMMADVKRAIAWMKVNAAEYGVNPERIVLMGGSAGGHLGLLAAYTPNHPQFDPPDVQLDTSVRAVVSYYGPPDLRTFYDSLQALPAFTDDTWLERRCRAALQWGFRVTLKWGFDSVFVPVNELIPNLLGGTPHTVPELYRLGSPITHIGPHCPPTLLLQGVNNVSSIPSDVRRFYRVLREARVTSIYVEFPDTEHGFDLVLPQWSPAAQAATYDTERFLALVV